MGKRKGTPEPSPDEQTPAKPDPREGKDKNPELAEKRKDVAAGVWDPKKSKALAKQMPSDKLVAMWEPIAEMFATMTDVALMLGFGVDETLGQVGKLSEREMIVQAWACRLAVEPPENIKQILSINLFAVYAFILLPRIQRVWLPKVRAWREERKKEEKSGEKAKGKAVGDARGNAPDGREVERDRPRESGTKAKEGGGGRKLN